LPQLHGGPILQYHVERIMGSPFPTRERVDPGLAPLLV